ASHLTNFVLYTICYVYYLLFLIIILQPHIYTLFPYTTLFRSRSITVLVVNILMLVLAAIFLGKKTTKNVALGSLLLPILMEITRSEEHTSELQSRFDLVCRLLLEKKKKE